MKKAVSRRRFMAGVSAAGALATAAPAGAAASDEPALLGGKPVRPAAFQSWPIIDSREDDALLDVVHSRKWGRGTGQRVSRFETEYSTVTGARHCLATSSGTTALFTAISALDVGPGDEVIVPPYTFIATVNVILLKHALPVFVDTDPSTFQIDATKVEKAITRNTRAIIPVHLGGGAADIDTVLTAGRKHNVPVLEDACQSHLAEWKGRKVGTYGQAGCFSFQASKNLNSGEGGAIISNDEAFIERCYTFHNNSRGRTSRSDFSYESAGVNVRLTEFQAAMLLAQMSRLEQQSKTREGNAAYLTSLLREVPGIAPARMAEGCTRNAYHLYMMRYNAAEFSGLPRAAFLKALSAEGIPASGGYSPLNREPFLRNTFSTRGYEAIYGRKRLAALTEANLQCPENDRLCNEAVWFTQNMLLGRREDMDQIADAIRKIRKHSARIARG